MERLCASEHVLDGHPMRVFPWWGSKAEFWERYEDRSPQLSSQPPRLMGSGSHNPLNSKVQWERKISQSEEPFLALLEQSKNKKGLLKSISINTTKGVISVFGTSQEIGVSKRMIREYIETVRSSGQSRTISPAVMDVLRRAGGRSFLEGLLREEDITATVRLQADRLEVFLDSAEEEEAEMALTHILRRKLTSHTLPVKEGQSMVLRTRLTTLSHDYNVSVEIKETPHGPILRIHGLTKDVRKLVLLLKEKMSDLLRGSSPWDIDIVTGALRGLSIDDAPFSQVIEDKGVMKSDRRGVSLETDVQRHVGRKDKQRLELKENQQNTSDLKKADGKICINLKEADSMSDVNLKNADKMNVNLWDAENKSVSNANRTDSTGDVNWKTTDNARDVNLKEKDTLDVKIKRAGKTTDANLKGASNLSDVNLKGAHNTSGVNLKGAHNMSDVNLKGAANTSDIDLKGAHSTSDVDLKGAHNTSDANLNGASNPSDVNLKGAHNTSGVNLKGAHSMSQVDLKEASNLSDVNLKGAHNTSGVNLKGAHNMSGVNLKGAHSMSDVDSKGASNPSDVNMKGAHSMSDVNLKGASNPSDVDLKGASNPSEDVSLSWPDRNMGNDLSREDTAKQQLGSRTEGHAALCGFATINETMQPSEIEFIEAHLKNRFLELRKYFKELGGHIDTRKDTSILSFGFPGNNRSAHEKVREFLAVFTTDMCRISDAGSYKVLTSPEGRARLADLEYRARCAIVVSRYLGPGFKPVGGEEVDVRQEPQTSPVSGGERSADQESTKPPGAKEKASRRKRTAAKPARKTSRKETSSWRHGRPGKIDTDTRGDREYRLGKTRMILTHDSITETKAAILVHILDRKFTLDTSLSRKFVTVGGKKLEEAILHNKRHEGEGLFVTRGFSIPACKFVYHAPLPTLTPERQSELVSGVVSKALYLANSFHSPSVAFPTLDARPLNIKLRSMAEAFFTALVDFLVDNQTHIQVIKLCVPNKEKFRVVQQFFDEVIPNAQSFFSEISQPSQSVVSPATAQGSLTPACSDDDTPKSPSGKVADESIGEGTRNRQAPSAGAACQITAYHSSDIQAVKTGLDAIVRDLLADREVELPGDCRGELPMKNLFKFCIKQNVIQLPDRAQGKVRLIGTVPAVERALEFIRLGLPTVPATTVTQETSV